MPYINQDDRRTILDEINVKSLANKLDHPGKLNYLITLLVHEYVQKHGVNYKVLNEALGVLDAASKEFYRTVVAPYEFCKIIENGFISQLDRVGD